MFFFNPKESLKEWGKGKQNGRKVKIRKNFLIKKANIMVNHMCVCVYIYNFITIHTIKQLESKNEVQCNVFFFFFCFPFLSLLFCSAIQILNSHKINCISFQYYSTKFVVKLSEIHCWQSSYLMFHFPFHFPIPFPFYPVGFSKDKERWNFSQVYSCWTLLSYCIEGLCLLEGLYIVVFTSVVL